MQMADPGLLKPGERRTVRRQRHRFNHRAQRRDGYRCGDRASANGIEPGREIGVTGFGDIPTRRRVSAIDHRALPLAEMGQAVGAVDSILSNRDDGEAIAAALPTA